MTVTCIVDNSVDVLLPSAKGIERAQLQNWLRAPLVAEHGFSALVSLEEDGKKRGILLDSGLSPNAALNNVEALGLDLSSCEAVVSSHGHVDHAGGLIRIKEKIGQSRIPLILHPHAFRNRVMRFPDGRILPFPAPIREQLESVGYDITERTDASLIIDGRILITGEIPRTNDFEKGNPIHFSEIDGKMESDPLIQDDQAVVVDVRNKGLVVITGCGHSGIVNTVERAKELTGEDRVFAIMGGMHLSGGIFEPIIPRTVQELNRISPNILIACHCTGMRAIQEMARTMPHSVVQNSVGTTYLF